MKRLSAAALVGAIGAAGIAVLAYTYSASAQDADAALLAEGDEIFHSIGCSGCHGAEGGGGAGPELAGNSALSSAGHVISMVLYGNEEHGMPPFINRLNDREIAAVGTYIRNSWGNSFGIVREASVAPRRTE